jgi:protein-disulfide isomerase
MSKEGMSKRQIRREQRRRAEQRNKMAVVAVVVLVALVIAAFLILPNFTPVGEIQTADSFERPQPEGNAAGDPNAPIQMVEYSDFQCPFCAKFSEETEPRLMEEYVATGKVYFIYRSMGRFIGQESVDAAEAAYCAGDQGKFWEMHDIIFANQTGENVGNYTPKRLNAFAETIGLDVGQFRSCFEGGDKTSQVNQDQVDGGAAGISATPAFVLIYTVDGETKTQKIDGAVPFEEFQKAIDQILAEIEQ